MMDRFESGVLEYVPGYTVLQNGFPVDKNGKAYINCENCYYFKDYSNKCGINREPCFEPKHYVGGACPMFRNLIDALNEAGIDLEELKQDIEDYLKGEEP